VSGVSVVVCEICTKREKCRLIRWSAMQLSRPRLCKSEEIACLEFTLLRADLDGAVNNILIGSPYVFVKHYMLGTYLLTPQ
jgi:hypothetical protein